MTIEQFKEAEYLLSEIKQYEYFIELFENDELPKVTWYKYFDGGYTETRKELKLDIRLKPIMLKCLREVLNELKIKLELI